MQHNQRDRYAVKLAPRWYRVPVLVKLNSSNIPFNNH